MRFLNWRRTNGGVRVSVRIQRTPQHWLFQWETIGKRRYSKRELLDIEMRVRKFVNLRVQVPPRTLETETHTIVV
jgi:hypothetical protein